MDDKKTSEDEFFVEDLDEEFDFGEDSESAPSPSSSPGGLKGPNKKVIIAALAISILGLGGFFGYRYFAGPKATVLFEKEKGVPSPLQGAKGKEPKKTEMAKKSNLEDIIKAKTGAKPPLPAKESTPSVAAIPTPSPTPETLGSPSPKTEKTLSESDIAKAFSDSPDALQSSKAPEKTIAPTTKPDTKPDTKSESFTKETTETAQSPSITGTTPAPLASKTFALQGPETKADETKESTIQELQQELFTPKPKEIPPHPSFQKETEETLSQKARKEKELDKSSKTADTSPSKSLSNSEIEQMNRVMQMSLQLNRQMENNLNQIKYLEAYTREISETVTKLNSQISAMDNRILALTNTATSLSKDVGNVRNEVGHVKQALGDEGLYLDAPPRRVGAVMKDEGLFLSAVPKKCKVEDTIIGPAEPEFILHAVIPGRAWLKSSTGQIITVTEGDPLGNYGKVLVIDSANNIVLTSAGISFR